MKDFSSNQACLPAGRERPEPNSHSYYGEDVTQSGRKRQLFSHTKLFSI